MMTNAVLVIIAVLLFFILAALHMIADEIMRSRHQDQLQTSSRDDFSRGAKMAKNEFIMIILVVLCTAGYLIFV